MAEPMRGDEKCKTTGRFAHAKKRQASRRKRYWESSSIGHVLRSARAQILRFSRRLGGRYEISWRNTVQETGRMVKYPQPRVPAGIGWRFELRQQIDDSLGA